MDWGAIAAVGCTAAAGAGTVTWYLFRRLQGQVDKQGEKHAKEAADLREALAAHKLHVAENYVTNNELSKAIDSLNDTIKAVFAKLERIDTKLDGKADKA